MKNMKKALSGAMGATMLMSSVVAQAELMNAEDIASVTELAEESFDKLANVQGHFGFNQEYTTPTDDIFNLFGTVVTGMCAKPAFELENADVDFYFNVGGNIRHAYTVSLEELKKDATDATLLCACATGNATANATITGVSLENVLALAEVEDNVNTITIVGADGYKVSMPLRYALEKDAMIVYKVNGERVPSGTQLWVPSTVAQYFVRNVVDIELTAEETEPEIAQRDDALRAEVAFMNYALDTFTAGEEITFEGYADDCGSAIAAVEFSLDDGETWTAYETDGATSDKWVYWNYAVNMEKAGVYQLSVRARTQDGTVSPMSAKLNFIVEEAK